MFDIFNNKTIFELIIFAFLILDTFTYLIKSIFSYENYVILFLTLFFIIVTFLLNINNDITDLQIKDEMSKLQNTITNIQKETENIKNILNNLQNKDKQDEKDTKTENVINYKIDENEN